MIICPNCNKSLVKKVNSETIYCKICNDINISKVGYKLKYNEIFIIAFIKDQETHFKTKDGEIKTISTFIEIDFDIPLKDWILSTMNKFEKLEVYI